MDEIFWMENESHLELVCFVRLTVSCVGYIRWRQSLLDRASWFQFTFVQARRLHFLFMASGSSKIDALYNCLSSSPRLFKQFFTKYQSIIQNFQAKIEILLFKNLKSTYFYQKLKEFYRKSKYFHWNFL